MLYEVITGRINPQEGEYLQKPVGAGLVIFPDPEGVLVDGRSDVLEGLGVVGGVGRPGEGPEIHEKGGDDEAVVAGRNNFV